MALGQRFPQFRNRLVGRSLPDSAQELQEYLYEVWRYTQGIPGGFLDTVATTIRAGVAATAGSVLASWAAADHTHDVETAAPSNATGVAASEGTGTALMRADATIRDIILATAAAEPDGHVLQSNSGEALGVEWVPGFTRTETEFLREIVTVATSSGERGSRSLVAASLCDGRFASDRRSPCGSSLSSCCDSRGARR